MQEVIGILEKRYGRLIRGKMERKGGKDAFRMLISTILSQRTRDETTEAVSMRLFSKLKTIKDFENADTRKIRALIKGIGFYNQKAKRIKLVAKILRKQFNGIVPNSREELLSMPGVGDKTADIVLCYAFGKPTIAIDVHVRIVCERLGIIGKKDKYDDAQKKIECVFRGKERLVNFLLVELGKEICQTRKPKCQICPITKYCAYFRKYVKRDN